MTRNLSLLCLSVLVFIGSARAQQDPYSDSFVRDVLKSHVIPSQIEKAVSRLGDRAAVAVIRSLADREMRDPEEMRKILWVLQTSFSVPQNIAELADRTPKATLFLLRCMAEAPVGRELAEEIEATKKTVLSTTLGAQRNDGR